MEKNPQKTPINCNLKKGNRSKFFSECFTLSAFLSSDKRNTAALVGYGDAGAAVAHLADDAAAAFDEI